MLTGEEIAELQQLIDEADPFMTDHLYSKSTDEIQKEIEHMTKELERIQKMNNEGWAKRQQKNLRVALAMHQLKSHLHNENKEGFTLV